MFKIPWFRKQKNHSQELDKNQMTYFFIRTITWEIWNPQSGFVPTFYDPAEVKKSPIDVG